MSALPVPIQQSIVIRGQRAWSRIKSTAAEQRELWREVGEALLYGRSIRGADETFTQWCDANGFADISRGVRADAMWLASNWSQVYTACTSEIGHPTHIRQAHRLEAPAPRPDLHIDTPSRLVAGIEVVSKHAKTINKLSAMAERGEGQERETAKKYLAKKAKDFGMDSQELSDLAKRLDPEAGVPPSHLPVLQRNVAKAVGLAVAYALFIKEAQAGGMPISRDAALAIAIEAFNQAGVAR